MIIGITKEQGDELLTDFLVNIAKDNGSKRCAEESLKIMDEFNDSQLVISFIITDSMREQGLIPEHVNIFEAQIVSALSTMFTTCDKSDVPIPLQELFEGSDEEVIERVGSNRKMFFAIQQFVNAYYTYDMFESKYPEISKML